MIIKTCEQVTKYHPDKIADQIGDFLVNELGNNLHQAIEVQIKGIIKDNVHIVIVNLAGEVTITSDEILKKSLLKVKKLVKKLIECDKIKINNYLNSQSSQINDCANTGFGDQGTYMAYAYNDKKTNYLPPEYYYASKVIEYIENYYKSDAKCLTTFNYTTNEIESIRASVCIKSDKDYYTEVQTLTDLLKKEFNCNDVIINEKTYWTFGSVFADCGVLGRKVACDNYGFLANGGVFYGKDISKSDRTIPFYQRLLAIKYCQSHKDIKSIRIDSSGMIGDTNLSNILVEVIDKDGNIINPVDFIDLKNISFEEIKDIIKNYKIQPNRPFMTFGLK